MHRGVVAVIEVGQTGRAHGLCGYNRTRQSFDGGVICFRAVIRRLTPPLSYLCWKFSLSVYRSENISR